MKNIKCVKECGIYGKSQGKRCYHDWQKCVGDFKFHLSFAFCRIQYRVSLFDYTVPFIGKKIEILLPFGVSIFIKQIVYGYLPEDSTIWYLPFLKLKYIETKYHYTSTNTDNKLISFSVGKHDFGNKVNPADLDNRIILFKTAFVNNQKLRGYSGEIYPEQDSSFELLKELHTPAEKKNLEKNLTGNPESS